MLRAIVDVFGVERRFFGSQLSPKALQTLPKHLSLPSEKIDIDAANDALDDVMSRVYINDEDEGQLEASTALNDNLSIVDEFNEESFSTTIALLLLVVAR